MLVFVGVVALVQVDGGEFDTNSVGVMLAYVCQMRMEMDRFVDAELENREGIARTIAQRWLMLQAFGEFFEVCWAIKVREDTEPGWEVENPPLPGLPRSGYAKARRSLLAFRCGKAWL